MSEHNDYGTWPYSGEIDIMEHIGSDPRMISHAVHTANKNGTKGNNWYRRIYQDNVENNFHVYSLLWAQDEIQFIVDDVVSTTLYRNFTEDYRGWPFNIDYHVILNLAMGGTMGGTIDDNIFNNPVEMKVDYVRIYQLNTAVDDVQDIKIDVFPSHFSNNLHIRTETPTEIKIFNFMGKIIFEKIISGTELVDTNYFPCGIYIVQSPSETMKIIKQ
jgi:beta-glucanase (GH16 family)